MGLAHVRSDVADEAPDDALDELPHEAHILTSL